MRKILEKHPYVKLKAFKLIKNLTSSRIFFKDLDLFLVINHKELFKIDRTSKNAKIENNNSKQHE